MGEYMPIRGVPVDTSKLEQQANSRNTAQATDRTRELIEELVENSMGIADAAEERERQMLRWTQAGVVLAAIAAIASVVALVVAASAGG